MNDQPFVPQGILTELTVSYAIDDSLDPRHHIPIADRRTGQLNQPLPPRLALPQGMGCGPGMHAGGDRALTVASAVPLNP